MIPNHGDKSTHSIAAVIFDVGETLVDETRVWAQWAAWMDVPALTFFAVIGAVIARGEPHQRVFEILDPDFDWRARLHRDRDSRHSVTAQESDFYPDARPVLERLTTMGIRIGVAANQPAGVEAWLKALQPPLELVGISDVWGLSKPDPRFFQRIAGDLALAPDQIAYVGDRIDNDIRPAAAAGMLPVLIRRGPWGHIQAARDLPSGTITIATLAEIPTVLFGPA